MLSNVFNKVPIYLPIYQNHSHSQNKIILQFKGNIRLSYHRFHKRSMAFVYVFLNEKSLLTVTSYLFLY